METSQRRRQFMFADEAAESALRRCGLTNVTTLDNTIAPFVYSAQ